MSSPEQNYFSHFAMRYPVVPGKDPKINKRRGTFIPDSRVNIKAIPIQPKRLVRPGHCTVAS